MKRFFAAYVLLLVGSGAATAQSTGAPVASAPTSSTLTPPASAKPAAVLATPAAYEGCVTKLGTADAYVLATGGRCLLLRGDFAAETVADRMANLHGLVLEPAGLMPLTLKVDRVIEVKGACTVACVLLKPGGRGVGPPAPPCPKKNADGPETPGRAAGTPGVTPVPCKPNN